MFIHIFNYFLVLSIGYNSNSGKKEGISQHVVLIRSELGLKVSLNLWNDLSDWPCKS